jgi:hypothetical protein
MMVATKDFSFVYDGERDEAIAGMTRVEAGHELVERFPDCWRDMTDEEELRHELQVRSDRVRQLQRDADRPTGRRRGGGDGDWPEHVRRQRDEKRFWDRMLNELDPIVDEHDPALDAVEAFDEARAAEWHDDVLEAGWHGRIG